MSTSTQPKEWRVLGTGNHQALIVDEGGRDVAVAYDKADAPLLAAAPELVDALQELRSNIDVSTINTSKKSQARWAELAEKADAAISKAKGTT